MLVVGLLVLFCVFSVGCGDAPPARIAPSAVPEPTRGVGDASSAQMAPSAVLEPARSVDDASSAQMAPSAVPEPTRGVGDASSAQMAPSAVPEPTGVVGDASPAQIPLPSTWVLEVLDGQPPIEESFVVLYLTEYSLEGFDGCNRYGGRSRDATPIFDADGTFVAPPVTITDTDCIGTEGLSDQADAYIRALMQARKFFVADDRLEVSDSEGAARLVLVRQAPLYGLPIQLAGTEWRLLNEGDARAATLAFLDGRLVIGTEACRTFLATYQGTEGSVRFTSQSLLPSTQACKEESRRVQSELGNFLSWARDYAVAMEGDTSLLKMRSSRGKTLTFEPLTPVEDITAREWTLVAFIELGGLGYRLLPPRYTPAVSGTEVTISLERDGVTGSSGCNTYRVPATIEDGSITIDAQSYSQTQRACEGLDGLVEQEERYLDLMPRVASYRIYDDRLFLQADEDMFLLFKAE